MVLALEFWGPPFQLLTNASANLLGLPSKSALAVLARKVVPRAPEGSQGGSKKRTLGGFWAPLGSLGTHLGSFSDRFEVVLGSFEVPFGIFWGSFWDLLGIICESLFRFFRILNVRICNFSESVRNLPENVPKPSQNHAQTVPNPSQKFRCFRHVSMFIIFTNIF